MVEKADEVPVRRGLPLRPTLLTVVVLLIVLVAGGVGLLAYSSSSRIVDHLWRGYSQQISSSAMQRSLRYFEPAPPYVELTLRGALEGRLRLNDSENLLRHFHAAIDANQEFTWASYGAEDGSYVAVHRLPDGEIRGAWRTLRPQVNANDLNHTVMRELRPVAGQGFARLGTQPDSNYDPRERPWYQNATEEGGWVEPFVFATVRQPGFMYVRRVVGPTGPKGVLAVEYEMSGLSEFLSTLTVGDNGRVYIVTADGLVVGHPEGATTTEVDGEVTIARASDHPDPMLAQAWQAISASGHDQGEIRFGDYLGMVERFPESSGIDWRVVVVAPESDFFGEVHKQAWQTLLIALLAALLAIVLGAFFATRVSGALRVIADELVRIGRFEVEDGALEETESFVREVNDMRDTTSRMKRSLRSFGKYVPKALVRELILTGEEAELGGRMEELSVLFSDIAGFTTVAEGLKPDELVQVLAEYLDVMSHAVRSEGGTVDKYIGDAIMAFWGAPRDNAEHALAACRGALAMKKALAELQKKWAKEGLPRLDTRIGVNTGEMLVGNIGAPDRLNYTVMGDPVNLGARLEALNKHYGTGILIGDETAKKVAEHMVLRPLEWVAVKGKDHAVLIHELCGAVGDVSDEELAAIERYAAALDAYRARKFEDAATGFEAAAAAYEGLGREDMSSARMAARCRAFMAEAPPEDWDGSTSMTTK